MRILVVEDEPKLGRLLVRGLGEEGHPTDLAPTGEEALWMAGAAPYDAIVLDVMLPGIDGFATCTRAARPRRLDAGADADRARRDRGQDRGARHGRRRLPRQAVRLQRAARAPARAGPAGTGRTADRARRSTTSGSTPPRIAPGAATTELDLTAKEFVLLEAFMRRPGEVLSRVQLLDAAWDSPSRASRTSSTSTSATCARRSTARSAATRSRPCAASGTG